MYNRRVALFFDLCRLALPCGVLFLFAGCGGGSAIPDIVPLSVVVNGANGKPVNQVSVRFIPQVDGLDGNYIASGITDDEGRCELSLPGQEDSGVPACSHKVQITEAGVSEEAERAYMAGNPSVAEKEKSARRNRPIPKKYTLLSSTPFLIEVTSETTEIVLALER